jgi:dihydroorotate dehydrogenase electron transfer subunit
MSALDPKRPHRGTIMLHDGEILQHDRYADDQFILRVHAPPLAERARAGSFAHLSCDDELPMRRPLSIMRADSAAGWLEFLYKTHGHGLTRLARRRPGEHISVLGPIGQPFRLDPQRPRLLLLGGGVGIPPMLFLAESLRVDRRAEWHPLVLMGSEIAFPFELAMAPAPVQGLPASAAAALQVLETSGIASRLTSMAGLPGCYPGYVTDLARVWLAGLDPQARSQVGVYACGPTPMLRAVAALAAEFTLPCQVSLEEYMACAVGGCAGCAVEVRTDVGRAMKRVCVDGPVFEASQVFF